MMGHLTGIGWRWALDPSASASISTPTNSSAIRPARTVAFMRTDVPPGIKVATDIVKAQRPDLRRARPGQRQGSARSGCRSICSAFRTGMSPAIAAARMRGSRCSRARSISIRNRRRAIAPWCIPASSRRAWRSRSGTRPSAADWPRSRSPISASRPFDRGVQGREGKAAGRAAVGGVQDRPDRQRHHDPDSRAAAGRAAAGRGCVAGGGGADEQGPGLCRRRDQDHRLRAGIRDRANTNREVRTGLAVSPEMRAFITDYVKKGSR